MNSTYLGRALQSHGRGIWPRDVLRKVSRGLSRVEAGNPGFPKVGLARVIHERALLSQHHKVLSHFSTSSVAAHEGHLAVLSPAPRNGQVGWALGMGRFKES